MIDLSTLTGYLERGWYLFPCYSMHLGFCTCNKGRDCDSPGKHPRTMRGVKDASNDPEKIALWSLAYPDANWALACGAQSGVFVVDIDRRHGGFESFAQWTADHEPLPETLTVLTGGGGRHLFFAYPEAGQLGNRTNWLPGVDIKSDGGYVILAGSNHVSGGTYCWKNDVDPASAPLTLTQSIAKRERDNSSGSTDDQLYARIQEGNRNDEVFKRACSFVRRLGDAPAAVDGVKAILRGLIENPATFPEAELNTTVQSAVKTVRESGELPDDADEAQYRRELARLRVNGRAREAYEEEERERRAREARASLPPVHAMSLDDHLASDEEIERTWTIPGRLPDEGRVIVTASEGFGKSTLVRYLGAAAAAGVDPFDWENRERYEPKRVLLVDSENDYKTACLRMKELRQRWDDRVPGAGDLIGKNFGFRPVGEFGMSLSLEDAADVERLRSWVEAHKPDLVLIGPIYQLTDETDHDAAFNAVIGALDKLRKEFGFSTIMEAHTPHDAATLRPYGSSGWKRWPEIGFHVGGTNGKVTHWRGCRYGTDVEWPDFIRRETEGQVMFASSRPTVGEVAQQVQDGVTLLLNRLLERLDEITSGGSNSDRTISNLAASLHIAKTSLYPVIKRGQEDDVLVVRSAEKGSGKWVFRTE